MDTTQELIQEINQIGEELAKIKSVTGLLMNQTKIQELYEKYIFLKIQEEQKLNLSHFRREMGKESYAYLNQENPIPSSETIQNQVPLPEEKQQSEIIATSKDTENIEDTPQTQQQVEVPPPTEPKKTDPEKPIKLNIKPNKTYPDLQVNLNDRIAFIAHLFGDTEKCTAAVEALNHLQSKEESIILYEEMYKKFDWNKKQEYADRLKELIENRFA